jgi:hypothetical protein
MRISFNDILCLCFFKKQSMSNSIFVLYNAQAIIGWVIIYFPHLFIIKTRYILEKKTFRFLLFVNQMNEWKILSYEIIARFNSLSYLSIVKWMRIYLSMIFFVFFYFSKKNRWRTIYLGVLNDRIPHLPFFVLSVKKPNHIPAKLSPSSLNYSI